MHVQSSLYPHRSPRQHHRDNRYFTEFTFRKGVFYAVTLVYVLSVSVVVVLELLLPDSAICNEDSITQEQKALSNLEYGNSMYEYKPCRHVRSGALLFFTRTECSYGRRLLMAVFLGGIVGWERRQADRPAGIRTMSLVALGSCLFSINSAFAFADGPMTWDASRVAAAIPSGVGFLGAGLIFKEADKNKESGDTIHVVHGLTTAASLWIVSKSGAGAKVHFDP
jgi:hypothetical protein